MATILHELKIWPAYYGAVKAGVKTFEYRENDRNFCVGDTIRLREYEPESKKYTDNPPLDFRIGYILNVSATHVVFSLSPFEG